MQLIDHTGHIYTLPSFTTYPFGYEYETFKYIMWLEDEYVRRLSINEWYIRPVRVTIPRDKGLSSLSIKVDSSVFFLIGGKTIQEKVQDSGFNIELDEDSDVFKKELSLDDLQVLQDDDDILITFYVAGNAKEEATWTSNILIDAVYENGDEEWCPVTVGGVFRDENEPLVINGRNMGMYFPKDILKAMYPYAAGTSIYSNEVNEALYNDKVKEYLMNYMRLHGECGNIEQVQSSLKFFQWGNHISLVQLIRTDNDIITQYIRDFLQNTNDILWRMEHFDPSSLISLVVSENQETGEDNVPEFTSDFWGEMKPVMESLMSKLVYKEYDETGIKFYKPYYDYVMQELVLKLACLKYYYQKYFLPMHTMVLSASLQHRVHANDIKYTAKSFINITEETICAEADRSSQVVTFPEFSTLYAYTQKHYVDSNFNEFDNYATEGDILIDTDIYYIDDICVALPIKFNCSNMDFFKCHLVLERIGGTVMFESDFNFSKTSHDYLSFIIYPKLMNDWNTMNYWEGKKYCLHLNVNDVWYEYKFTIKVPELHLMFGRLHYRYNNMVQRQVNEITDHIDFQSFMYVPSLIDVDNINFPQEVVEYGHDGVMEKFIDMYREKPSLPSDGTLSNKYYNRVHYFKLLDENGNEIRYTGNQDDTDAYDENIINLYKTFFNEDGTQKYSLSADGLDYDIYLMHDSKYPRDYQGVLDEETINGLWLPHWYVVLISRQTIDHLAGGTKGAAPEFTILGGNSLKYMKSDNKWLINRMTYDACNGVNQFNKDDIIVGTVENIEFPFILQEGTKWNISPMSPGMQNDSEVESTTNTFLMSIGGDNTGYDKGYYNITVRYSLDGTVQYQRKHIARIKVK